MEEKKTTSAGHAMDQGTKIIAGVGYLGILFIIPLIMAGQDQYKKDASFLKYHANQGLVLLITEIALGIIVGFIIPIFFAMLSPMFFLFSFLSMAVWIVGLIFLILGFMNAMNGEKKPLPVIGGITIIK